MPLDGEGGNAQSHQQQEQKHIDLRKAPPPVEQHPAGTQVVIEGVGKAAKIKGGQKRQHIAQHQRIRHPLRSTQTGTARCRRFHEFTDQNCPFATPSLHIMTPKLDLGKYLRVKPRRANRYKLGRLAATLSGCTNLSEDTACR